jgi:hypothetical protein
MKLSGLMLAAGLALACGLAQAGETAYTVRPTALKEKPYSDAKTLDNLGQNAKVEIVGRRGSWNKIKVNDTTGWVKMLSLRLGDAAQKTGDTGFKTLFNVASTGGSGSTMTTGVRGLSEEKLHNPQPNPQAVEAMHRLAVSKEEAQQFAQAGKLAAGKMDYLPAPAAK